MASDKKAPIRLLSGHTVEPMEGEEAARYLEKWHGYSEGVMRIQPGGTLMPNPLTKYIDGIQKFKVVPDDVFLMTFPKCGTTWTQEIIWTMRNNPNLDNPKAELPTFLRSPFIEFDGIWDSSTNPAFVKILKDMCPTAEPADGICLQMAENIEHPRTIKTHLPFSLMPTDILTIAKVVYVVRNPKDMVVSFLHHCRLLKCHDFRGTVEEFVETFVAGDILYGHYDLHLKEAFERKTHKNLLILQFEDLKADPIKELTKLNEFLGTDLSSQQIENVANYTSFSEMKKRADDFTARGSMEGEFNPEVMKKDGTFFRKGESGTWKDKLTPELEAKIDAWVEDKLKGSGVTFRYSV